MSEGTPPNHPSLYVRGHIGATMAMYASTYGATLRRMWMEGLPGLPTEVGFGFTSNGNQYEDTSAAARAWLAHRQGRQPAHAAYSEVGAFGVPAGPYCLQPPAAVVRSPSCPSADSQNVWLDVHDSPLVKRLLGGREACMRAGCWTAAEDQIAVGVAQLVQIEAHVRLLLPASLRPQQNSLWRAAMVCYGWSTGPGATAAQMAFWLRRYPELATTPESRRFWRLGELMAASRIRSGAGSEVGFATTSNHSNHGHAWIRAAQKLQTGWAVAQRTHGNVAFFAAGAPSPATLAFVEAILGYSATRQPARLAGPQPPATATPVVAIP